MDSLEKAIRNLWINRKIELADREIILAILLREGDRPIVAAPWWKSKEASILGVDYSGNFILRLSNGSVCLWDHKIQDTIPVANSVKNFVAMLKEDTNT